MAVLGSSVIVSGGGGAPADADYLVGTADGGLSGEIVVGATPGGELGGTWATPTVDGTHSGSAHHTKYTDAEAIAAVEGEATLVLQSGLTVDGDVINEKGTFTPALADDSLDGTGESQAYSTQVGRYTKIGNRVYFSLRLITSSIGSLTGNQGVRIVGLPFTSNSTSNSDSSASAGSCQGAAITAGEVVTGRILPSASDVLVSLWDVTTGTSSMRIDEWTADGGIFMSGHYEV